MAASLTQVEILAIVIVVVLAVSVAGVLLFLMRRLRLRKAKLLNELRVSPQLVQDRAFNRIAMARREAEILSRQGTDVSRAHELIAQAQGSLDTGSYDRAYQSAQEAHEALVRARQQGAPLPAGSIAPAASLLPSGPSVPAPGGSTPRPPGAVPVSRQDPATPPTPAGIPKNRAESQFQLRLLDQELQEARRTRSDAATVREARLLRTQAGAASDRADYTEAFRLALKGRRSLGGHLETLAPSPGTHPEPTTGSSVEGERAQADPALTAERVAGSDRCPECGYPALPGDAFCRGCGVPRSLGTCSGCGTPRGPRDTFCGKCGTPFT